MRIALKVWGVGLFAAASWLVALGHFLAQPDRQSAPLWAWAIGAVGGIAGALAAGRLAGRSADAPRVDGAWAGAHVGGFAWLFGLAPLLSVWTQLPALHPRPGAPDARTVLATALAESSYRASLSFGSSAAVMLLGGALLGALGARGGGRGGLPFPHRTSTAAALIALALNMPIVFAVFEAIGRLEGEIRGSRDNGSLLVDLPALGRLVHIQTFAIGATAMVCAAIAVAGLRARLRSWFVILVGPLAIASLGLHDEQAYAWSALIVAGALIGAGLPLRPAGEEAPPAGFFLLRVVPFAVAGLGAGVIAQGIAVGVGAVARIPALRQGGAAAAPELVGLLARCGLLAGPSTLVGAALVLLLTVPILNWVIDLGHARREFLELLVVNGAGPRPEELEMQKTEGVSRRMVAAIVVACLAVGALASGAALSMGRQVARRHSASDPPREDLVEVVIATRVLPVGRPIEPGDVALRGMPAIAVPAEVAVMNPDHVIGKAPVERIVPNEVVRWERMGEMPPAEAAQR